MNEKVFIGYLVANYHHNFYFIMIINSGRADKIMFGRGRGHGYIIIRK